MKKEKEKYWNKRQTKLMQFAVINILATFTFIVQYNTQMTYYNTSVFYLTLFINIKFCL